MDIVNCHTDCGGSFPSWLISNWSLLHELDNVAVDACLMEKVEVLVIGDVGFPAFDGCCELVVVISVYAEGNCPMSSFPVLYMTQEKKTWDNCPQHTRI